MDERVCVTGAAGFIAGHAIQALAKAGIPVVATARSPVAAAATGRFAVPLVLGDLGVLRVQAEAVQGCRTVVHCAQGEAVDQSAVFRSLVRSAAAAGVRDFVHLSTVEVYARQDGRVGDTDPILEGGDGYGPTKAKLERILIEHADSFESVTILRPAIVYGPNSTAWCVEPIRRMVTTRQLPPAEKLSGTCNVVHVWDVARAIRDAVLDPGRGPEAFNVVGPAPTTWAQYYAGLASQVEDYIGERLGGTNRGDSSPRISSLLRLVGRAVLPSPAREALRSAAFTSTTLTRLLDQVAPPRPASEDWDRKLYRRNAQYEGVALAKRWNRPKIGLKEGLAHVGGWAALSGLLGIPLDGPTVNRARKQLRQAEVL